MASQGEWDATVPMQIRWQSEFPYTPERGNPTTNAALGEFLAVRITMVDKMIPQVTRRPDHSTGPGGQFADMIRDMYQQIQCWKDSDMLPRWGHRGSKGEPHLWAGMSFNILGHICSHHSLWPDLEIQNKLPIK